MEAMVAALAYVAVLAAFIGAIHSMMDAGNGYAMEIKAELEVQKCAGLIDAMTSNSGVAFDAADFSCTMKDGRVVYAGYESSKSEKPLNPETELSEKSGAAMIIVKGGKHYAE